MDKEQEKKAWREVKYKEKFSHAFRGLRVFAATTKHLILYKIIVLIIIILGFYFHISGLEWIAIIFMIGFVFVAEAFNTAIEIDIDLTSPEYHPYARDTKDVAAAAVLLSVFTAIIVGLIVFLPKI
ncbi:MAG TPA: diacylglycerol kinase family protein, partial [Candidatus Paceibacterota bacterium]|nr:diacylglycerol kinase family protein [Candidatus Paceibacterota bacterium]